MKRELNVGLFQFVFSLSQALDLINPSMAHHHKRVAYIALRLAQAAGLTGKTKEDVFIAAALHDVGALSFLNVQEEREHGFAWRSRAFNLRSANYGYRLLQKFRPFAEAARILRFHNVAWSWGNNRQLDGENVPPGSHIVYLANLVDHLLDKQTPILQQTRRILDEIEERSGRELVPEYVDLFRNVAHSDAFWLDLNAPELVQLLFEEAPFSVIELDLDGLLDFADLLAQIIDFRSRHTATHSRGVAACAATLAQLFGFPEIDCKRLQIAGYLHDIGKLVMPVGLMDKTGRLNEADWRLVRSHPYHSYRILTSIRGMEDIAHWCGLHHERLNGQGYPYLVSHRDIPLEARILAVADVFTALTEARPYRQGLPEHRVRAILGEMVAAFELDRSVVRLLEMHYGDVNRACGAAQSHARNEYRDFMESVAVLDLSGARAAHLAWKQRLRAFLDGRIELDRESLVSHHECDLGRWYYGEGLAHYGDIPEMRALESPHADLHRLIHTLVTHLEQGRAEAAESCYAEVEPLSRQIIDLLDSIERKAARAWIGDDRSNPAGC